MSKRTSTPSIPNYRECPFHTNTNANENSSSNSSSRSILTHSLVDIKADDTFAITSITVFSTKRKQSCALRHQINSKKRKKQKSIRWTKKTFFVVLSQNKSSYFTFQVSANRKFNFIFSFLIYFPFVQVTPEKRRLFFLSVRFEFFFPWIGKCFVCVRNRWGST